MGRDLGFAFGLGCFWSVVILVRLFSVASAEDIRDDQAFLDRETVVKGEGVAEPPVADVDTSANDWSDTVVDLSKVCVSKNKNIVAFADIETLCRYFKYWFVGVNIVTSDEYGAEVFNTINHGTVTLCVAEQLDIPEDSLSLCEKLDVFAFRVGDSEHAVVHVKARCFHTLAMFTRKPGCLFTLTSHITKPCVISWDAKFLSFTCGGRTFFLVPNFQAVTGSGCYEEALRVFDITDGHLDELARLLVFEDLSLWNSQYLRSEVVVDHATRSLVVNKEVHLATGDGPVTVRHEREVIDLREKPENVESPKPVTKEEFERLRKEGDLL